MDSHCHIDRVDLEQFDHDQAKMFARTAELDVKHMICVCIDMENFPAVHKIAMDNNNIHCSVGLHPTECDGVEPSFEDLVEKANLPKVVAIGETGLDYFRNDEKSADWQRDRFRTHIRAANEVDKPLIIHTRMAREDTIRILKEEKARPGVLHCFTENWEMAKAALDLGYYISFSGIVTFKNAKDLQEVAAKVPLDRILVETDSPYLTPAPFRGKPNFPGNTHYVAKFLSEMRGFDYSEFCDKTTQNVEKLFGIDLR